MSLANVLNCTHWGCLVVFSARDLGLRCIWRCRIARCDPAGLFFFWWGLIFFLEYTAIWFVYGLSRCSVYGLAKCFVYGLAKYGKMLGLRTSKVLRLRTSQMLSLRTSKMLSLRTSKIFLNAWSTDQQKVLCLRTSKMLGLRTSKMLGLRTSKTHGLRTSMRTVSGSVGYVYFPQWFPTFKILCIYIYDVYNWYIIYISCLVLARRSELFPELWREVPRSLQLVEQTRDHPRVRAGSLIVLTTTSRCRPLPWGKRIKAKTEKADHAQEAQWEIVGALARLEPCNVDTAGAWLTITPPVVISTRRVNTALHISTRMQAKALGQNVWSWPRRTSPRLTLEVCVWRRDPKVQSRDRDTRSKQTRRSTWTWSWKRIHQVQPLRGIS